MRTLDKHNKKFIVLFILLGFGACYPWKANFLYQKQWYKRFDRKDIEAIKQHLNVESINGIPIQPDEVDSTTGTGSWTYAYSSMPHSCYETFLKGPAVIYFFSEKDSFDNLRNVNHFLNEFGHLFSSNQRLIIRDNFLAGQQCPGNQKVKDK